MKAYKGSEKPGFFFFLIIHMLLKASRGFSTCFPNKEKQNKNKTKVKHSPVFKKGKQDPRNYSLTSGDGTAHPGGLLQAHKD